MGKNNEEYSESSERYKTFLNQFVYCKRSQPCIHKSDIYWGDRQKLKNINSRCWSNELAFNLFNSFLSCSYNNVRANFIKSVGIYQLLILQFTVTNAEVSVSGTPETNNLKQILDQVTSKADAFWKLIEQYLCNICNRIGLGDGSTCKELYVSIPVVVFLFLFVFTIICLICCKCCCKKSRKKKASEGSNVNHDQFIMGLDGQMYSQMCQGQMMQPQMIPAGMMYPQMYPGQMFYPQMFQQGMQYMEMPQPEMQYMEMPQPEMQYMEMPQPEMQYMEMQQP